LVTLGAQYTVTMASAVVDDYATPSLQPHAGLSGSTYVFTVQDTVAPVITTYLPLHNAVDQLEGVDIVITFNEHVQAGTGNVVLTPVKGSHTEVSAGSPVLVDVTDTSQVTFSNTAGVGTMTVNPTSDLVTLGAQYTVTMASAVVDDLATPSLQPHAGLSGSTYVFTVRDIDVPTVRTYQPTINQTTVARDTLIHVRFTEIVQTLNFGYILFTPSKPTHTAEDYGTNFTIDINDTSQVLFNHSSGFTTMVLNLSSPLSDVGVEYTITMSSNIVADIATIPNHFMELHSPSYIFWVADTTSPALLLSGGQTPTPSQVGVSRMTNITITFIEDIQIGNPNTNITLTPSGGNQHNTPLHFRMNSDEVTVQGRQIRIDPKRPLDDRGGKTWTVDWPQTAVTDTGAFVDEHFNKFAGFNHTDYQFAVIDVTPPNVLSESLVFDDWHHRPEFNLYNNNFSGYYPDKGSNVLKNTSIVLIFDEKVHPIAGRTITLIPFGGNQPNLPVVIEVTDTTQVTVSDTIVTIVPLINHTNTFHSNLADQGDKLYAVTIQNGSFVDNSTLNNEYGGIDYGGYDSPCAQTSAECSYTFTVMDSTSPKLLEWSPTGQEELQTVDIVLVFNENVMANSGMIITLVPSGGDGVNTNVTIDASDTSQVKVNGTTVTINPTPINCWLFDPHRVDYQPRDPRCVVLDDTQTKDYTVYVPAGAFQDVSFRNNLHVTNATWNFRVPDRTAPYIVSYFPEHKSINVEEGTNITLTFQEAIALGHGNISLTDHHGVLLQVNVNTSVEASIDDRTLKLNLAEDLIPGKEYRLSYEAGTILDLNSNLYGGPNSATLSGSTYSFMIKAKLEVDFSGCSILTGAEDRRISFVSEDSLKVLSLVQILDSQQVTISGNKIVFRPILSDEAVGRSYMVILGGGCLVDKKFGEHAGTALSFKTDQPIMEVAYEGTGIGASTALIVYNTNYVVTVTDAKYVINDVSQKSLTLAVGKIVQFNLDSVTVCPFLVSESSQPNGGVPNSTAAETTYQLDGVTTNVTAFVDGFFVASTRRLFVAFHHPIALRYYCNDTLNMGSSIVANATF